MYRHKINWVLALAAVLVSAMVALGCGDDKPTPDGGALNPDQTLKLNGSEPTTLDPALIGDLYSWQSATQMFAALYRLTGQNSEVTPYLAADLPAVSDDGLTYTVKLRDDAVWSDGSPITAAEVAYSVRRSLDPKLGAYFAGFIYGIVGSCEYNTSGPPGEGEAKGDDQATCGGKFQTDRKAESVGVAAVDEHTVEFKLNRPVPWFDQLLALGVFTPVPQKAIDKFGDKWTDPKNIVVSGAFTLESWDPKKKLVMARNDKFFGTDDITLNRVEMVFINSAQTALAEFKKGDLDSGFTGKMLPPEDIDDWKGRDEYVSVETASTSYLYLNTTNDELKDARVRQGISLAIDREALVKNVLKKGDVPLGTVIPTMLPGYDVIREGTQDFITTDAAPDVGKARELLEAGGWKEGTQLDAYFTTEGASGEDIMESVQSDLAKVGVTLKLVPFPTFGELYVPGIGVSPVAAKVDMVALGWIADYLDPQDFYQLWTCDAIASGTNNSNYCSKEFETVYDEAVRTVDTDARTEMYKELEGMLTGPDGDMPAIPLYQQTDNTLVQTWVDGLEFLPSGNLYFDDVKIYERT